MTAMPRLWWAELLLWTMAAVIVACLIVWAW